jgi:hypothetical protein
MPNPRAQSAARRKVGSQMPMKTAVALHGTRRRVGSQMPMKAAVALHGKVLRTHCCSVRTPGVSLFEITKVYEIDSNRKNKIGKKFFNLNKL